MYNVMQIHVTRDWLGWGRGTRDYMNSFIMHELNVMNLYLHRC
jgi:hypothetical protein